LSAYFPDIKITLTCVIPPLDPVLPKSCVTLALTGYESIDYYYQIIIFFIIYFTTLISKYAFSA